jgi:hypothetical protein
MAAVPQTPKIAVMHPPQPPTSPNQPGQQAPEPPDPADPVVASITSLVQEGTLSPLQANRVYAVVHPATQPAPRTLRAESPRYGAGWSFEQLSAGAASLVGGGLVVAAVLVANTLANRRRDFNWPAFMVELIAGLVIIAGAYAVWRLLPSKDATAGMSSGVASGLVALGAVALGLVIATAMDGRSPTPYIVGLVMFGLSAGAYWLLRGTILTISALTGLALFYGNAVNDTIAPDSALGVTLVIVLFGVITVAGGWILPSRHLTGVIGGIIALLGVLVSSVSGVTPTGPAVEAQSSDTGAVIVIGLLVTAALFALHVWSGYPGYAVLGVAGAALVPSVGLRAGHPDHMLWWSAGIAVLGCAALAAALVYRAGGARQLLDSARTAR